MAMKTTATNPSTSAALRFRPAVARRPGPRCSFLPSSTAGERRQDVHGGAGWQGGLSIMTGEAVDQETGGLENQGEPFTVAVGQDPGEIVQRGGPDRLDR